MRVPLSPAEDQAQGRSPHAPSAVADLLGITIPGRSRFDEARLAARCRSSRVLFPNSALPLCAPENSLPVFSDCHPNQCHRIAGTPRFRHGSKHRPVFPGCQRRCIRRPDFPGGHLLTSTARASTAVLSSRDSRVTPAVGFSAFDSAAVTHKPARKMVPLQRHRLHSHARASDNRRCGQCLAGAAPSSAEA